jgi:hypothetical protein
MEKTVFKFEDFISGVGSEYKDFVAGINNKLQSDGYKVKIESKASGFFISYSHPKTKRSILNFFHRKKGLYVRIYADGLSNYADILDALPDEMQMELAKAHVCKRLVNPDDCNPKCIMGYDFEMKGNRYQKCRYSCFQFAVDTGSIPAISDFIERERGERL